MFDEEVKKVTIISCENESMYGACGVGNFYDFEFASVYEDDDDHYWSLASVKNPGGADYAFAAFVHNEVCYKAYQVLAKRFKIVFQSEVRRNTHSKHQFFFCIYDTRI